MLTRLFWWLGRHKYVVIFVLCIVTFLSWNYLFWRDSWACVSEMSRLDCPQYGMRDIMIRMLRPNEAWCFLLGTDSYENPAKRPSEGALSSVHDLHVFGYLGWEERSNSLNLLARSTPAFVCGECSQPLGIRDRDHHDSPFLHSTP